MKYKVSEKKKEDGCLVAYFDLKKDTDKHITRGFKYFVSNKNRWVSYPSTPYQKDGKTEYYSFMFFEDREDNQLFQMQLLSAIDKYLETQLPVKEELPF